MEVVSEARNMVEKLKALRRLLEAERLLDGENRNDDAVHSA
ncbi:MAG: hypothetical protein QXO86_07665 [Nitrososphaerota archaeon]